MKIFRNTAAVLVLTLFTGLAVFTAIQLGDRLFGTSDAAAQTVSAQSSTSSGSASSSSGTTDQQQSSDPYGYGQSSGTQDSTGTTQTCPATGCTASSCHATQ